MREEFCMGSWRGWDRRIAVSCGQFVLNHRVDPNLLIVGPAMRRRLDIAAGAPQGIRLEQFQTDRFKLLVVEEADAPDRYFALAHAAPSLADIQGTPV